MFDLGDIAKLAGQVIGGMVGGPAGAMIGSMIGDMIGQAIEGQSLDLLGDSGLAEAALDLFQGTYQGAFNLPLGGGDWALNGGWDEDVDRLHQAGPPDGNGKEQVRETEVTAV